MKRTRERVRTQHQDAGRCGSQSTRRGGDAPAAPAVKNDHSEERPEEVLQVQRRTIPAVAHNRQQHEVGDTQTAQEKTTKTFANRTEWQDDGFRMMNQAAKTSIKLLNQENYPDETVSSRSCCRRRRHHHHHCLKRIRAKQIRLPYCNKLADFNDAPVAARTSKLLVMPKLCLAILALVSLVATCYAFAQTATSERAGKAGSAVEGEALSGLVALTPDQRLAGAPLESASSTRPLHSSASPARREPRAPASAWQSSPPSSRRRRRLRFRRASKSQTGAAATRARPAQSPAQQQHHQANQANRQQQQTAGELELLAQQQQQQTSARTIKNVTAQNGQSVLLHCLVDPTAAGELPEVSWFRGASELQLLTYDTTTIIPDSRFAVRPGLTRTNDYALQITGLNRTTDAGLYQCQTSGDSTRLQSYQLNIVEPQVDILGAPDLSVKLGGLLNLTCVISPTTDELQFVFWYRDDRMINYDFPESRAKIVLSKWSQQRGDSMASNLQIFQARRADSGNYTCNPSGARSSSIQVHVLDASDKRLMMFQQDDSKPLAASSQQTNSAAISAHVIRLGKGRAYALLVGLFILATWFQLIAQLQTLISLALVAAIGLLLGGRCGKVAAADIGAGMHKDEQDDEREALNSSASTRMTTRESDGATKKRQDGAGGSRSNNKKGAAAPSEGDGHDPLLEGAERALNLLRTLGRQESLKRERPGGHLDGSAESCSSIELDHLADGGAFRSLSCNALHDDDDDDEGRLRQLALSPQLDSAEACASLRVKPRRAAAAPPSARQALKLNEGGAHNGLAEPKQAQASPSCSSSSSSAASTGYNSDSTRLCSSALGAGFSRSTAAAATTTTTTTQPPRANVSLLLDESNNNNNNNNGSLSVHDELDEELQSELEVIELIKGRPTAMRLIIEHLQQSGQFGELAAAGGSGKTNSLSRNSGGVSARPTRETADASLIYASPVRRDWPVVAPSDHHNHHHHHHPEEPERPLDLTRSASAIFQRPD